MSSDWFGCVIVTDLLPRCEGVLGLGHLVVFLFGQCITYCNNGLNGLLGSRYFLYVINERTSFAS